jgi:hypothetical protein
VSRPKKRGAVDRRGFRKIPLSRIIDDDPKKASSQILAAYRLAGAELKKAAAVLGVAERTLHRYCDRLGLRPELEKLTVTAEREGWLSAKRNDPVTCEARGWRRSNGKDAA